MLLERRPRLRARWILTSLQNPLVALMPTARKRAQVQMLARHRVPLIEDDVYAELYDGASGHRPPPAKALDRDGNALNCSSFSRCLAPSYRVGWAAAGLLLRTVQRLKVTSTLATSLPPQLAIAECLATGGYDRHLRGLREASSRQRQRALRLLERNFPEGTRVTRPQGGNFLRVTYRRSLPERIASLVGHSARQSLEWRNLSSFIANATERSGDRSSWRSRRRTSAIGVRPVPT